MRSFILPRPVNIAADRLRLARAIDDVLTLLELHLEKIRLPNTRTSLRDRLLPCVSPKA